MCLLKYVWILLLKWADCSLSFLFFFFFFFFYELESTVNAAKSIYKGVLDMRWTKKIKIYQAQSPVILKTGTFFFNFFHIYIHTHIYMNIYYLHIYVCVYLCKVFMPCSFLSTLPHLYLASIVTEIYSVFFFFFFNVNGINFHPVDNLINTSLMHICVWVSLVSGIPRKLFQC